MGKSAKSHPPNLTGNTTVVDVDVHRNIDYSETLDYMSQPYRGQMEEFLSGGYSPRPLGGWNPNTKGMGSWKVTPEKVESHLMEEFDVDYPIINSLLTLPIIPQTGLALDLMRACNDLMIEEYLDKNDDFRGLVTITPQRPEAAAEELDRVGDEDQIVGAFMLSSTPEKPLGDSRYDIMYQAAEDNDLPMVYHAAAASSFVAQFPMQNYGLETFLSVHTLSHAWSQMLTLTSLLVNGTPEKFPDLNFVFLESGIAWIPYMMGRLNKEYASRRREAPLLEQNPEDYIRDSFYFGTQPFEEFNNENHARKIIDVVGVDSLMFASDYPHWDFDNPSEVDKFLRTHFSAEEREKLLHGTAEKAFGLDI